MMRELVHQVNRTITIRAHRDVVFRFFTDSRRWASWWGEGSTIEPRVGGRVIIRFPGGNEVVGEMLEIRPPERLVFTYGYVSGTPVPRGASRVTIELAAIPAGTRLNLLHEFDDASAAERHVQGWRYQLSLFSNLVANDLHADPAAIVDRWFEMWSNPDNTARARELDQIAAPDVALVDRFSAIEGVNDLRAHLDAVHRFMPGFTLRRDGDVRQCQGHVLSNWKGIGPDGETRATGTNLFTLTADGRIESVTGFWTT